MLILVSDLCVLFFFFKQKTAYEMRISDWSSDVCSSDLLSADLAHMDQGDLIGLTNYPQEWVEIYQRRNIVANDPILLASHQTNVGFAWDDIGDLINVTAQHREITSDTRRAGIGNGFTVPAHVPGEANGSRSEEHTSELQSLMRISYA